jgi:hypothetical protein
LGIDGVGLGQKIVIDFRELERGARAFGKMDADGGGLRGRGWLLRLQKPEVDEDENCRKSPEHWSPCGRGRRIEIGRIDAIFAQYGSSLKLKASS